MHIHNNVFKILGATPKDNLQRLMELADLKRLQGSTCEYNEALEMLSDPQKRLSAEIVWVSDNSPLGIVNSSINYILEHGFEIDSFQIKILNTLNTFDNINPKKLFDSINKDRKRAKFSVIEDLSQLDEALLLYKFYIKKIIASKLAELSDRENIELKAFDNDDQKHSTQRERYFTQTRKTPKENSSGAVLLITVIVAVCAFVWVNNKGVSTTNLPIQSPMPTFNEPIESKPANGYSVNYNKIQGKAQLTIKTPPGDDYYYVLLKNPTSNATEISIFIHPNSTAEIKVPLGEYKIFYASGKEWYGTKHIFGPKTSYSKADNIFNFYMQGNNIRGYTVTLIQQVDGNLHTSIANKSDFIE